MPMRSEIAAMMMTISSGTPLEYAIQEYIGNPIEKLITTKRVGNFLRIRIGGATLSSLTCQRGTDRPSTGGLTNILKAANTQMRLRK